MPDKIFVGLHNHSQASISDALCRPDDMARKAKELGLNALAITDHGTLASYVVFKNACEKYNIKSIFGVECYFVEDASLIFKINEEIKIIKAAIKELQQSRDKQDAETIKSFRERVEQLQEARGQLRKYNHLILLARNWHGYSEIIKIHNAAVLDFFYYKPRVDFSVLETHVTPGNIIATSACLGGTISRLLALEHFNDAKATALRFQNIFGPGNFYLEIQLNEIKLQRTVNIELIKLAEETGIPLTISCDVHYLEEGGERTRAFLKRGFKTDDADSSDNSSELKDLFIKNEDMLLSSWKEYMADVPKEFLVEAIQNTRKIADSIENFKFDSSLKFPNFDTGGKSQENFLIQKSIEGLKFRGLENNQVYLNRLEKELKTVNGMGFASYFNVVTDIVSFAKQNQAVGPARGCLDGEAIVPLATREFKKLKDVQVKDFVYDYTGTPREVLAKFEYPIDDEECLEISGRFFDPLTVTKNHLIWVKKSEESSFQWVKAEDLKKDDLVFISKIKSDANEIYSIDLAQYGDDASDSCAYLYNNGKIQKCKRRIILNKKFYYFLGRLASCSFIIENSRLEISIPFFGAEKKELEEFVAFLESLQIFDFELNHTEIPNAKTSVYTLTLFNKILINWLKEIFKIHKGYVAIPNLVYGSPSEEFIWEYLEGLSYNDKKALNDYSDYIDGPFSLSVQTKGQLDEIKRLFLQLGRPLDIQKIFFGEEDFIYKLAFIEKPPANSVNIKTDYELHSLGYAERIRNIVPKKVKMVYDIHVDVSGSYLANFYVHNSVGGSLLAYVLGITELDPIKFDLQFERFLSNDKVIPATFGLHSLELLNIDYDNLLTHLEHLDCQCHPH